MAPSPKKPSKKQATTSQRPHLESPEALAGQLLSLVKIYSDQRARVHLLSQKRRPNRAETSQLYAETEAMTRTWQLILTWTQTNFVERLQ